ncbi:MAG TPA: 3-methyl-2-oxobutanoate hydroxymethyltransferase [Sphingobacteriaceae bacterium]|nr:3-methyl-2-oxobutanoate hydroxymethyltransferase [Sphingobacteriaceae bacterium]
MSVSKEIKRKTTLTIREMKARGEKIAMLTGYDYSMATVLDDSGIDIILVGDSAANVMAGYDTTVPITLEEMMYHASSVIRASKQAMVVVDLPFGTYQGAPYDALDSAVKVMKQTGAHALKLEGGQQVAETIKLIVNAGIPVMGHLGLTPQSIHQFGSFGLRAKGQEEAQKLIDDALLLEEMGCFALVLEKIPAGLAAQVTQALSIPTIGIGAGNQCDGQVLVINDMLGLTKGFRPKFLRQYLNLYEEINKAVEQYIEDVKSGSFPNEKEQY